MKLVSAMCPNCGAQLELDENMEKGFCMYCGSQILVQDAVQKYKIELSGRVSVEGILSAEDLAKNGETFMKIGNIQQAYEAFSELSTKYPDDFRGWWGLVRAVTEDFSLMPSETNYHTQERQMAAEFFEYARKTAGNDPGDFKEVYEKWDKKYSHDQRVMELEAEYSECKATRSGAKGSQIFGGFASAGHLLIFIVLAAVSAVLVLLEIVLISEIIKGGSVGASIILGIFALVFFAPTLKLLSYTFLVRLPELIGAVREARDSARLSSEMKARMEEIDREYSDIAK